MDNDLHAFAQANLTPHLKYFNALVADLTAHALCEPYPQVKDASQ